MSDSCSAIFLPLLVQHHTPNSEIIHPNSAEYYSNSMAYNRKYQEKKVLPSYYFELVVSETIRNIYVIAAKRVVVVMMYYLTASSLDAHFYCVQPNKRHRLFLHSSATLYCVRQKANLCVSFHFVECTEFPNRDRMRK